MRVIIDLLKLSTWADQWKVNFAPTKGRITNRKHQTPLPNLFLCGEPIKETTQITTVGVTITNDLSWNTHIRNIITKSSKQLLVMKKYRHCLPHKSLETIYISMIRPILEYGNNICSSSIGRSIEHIQ